jgi:RND family efflux transporter MFP subunit
MQADASIASAESYVKIQEASLAQAEAAYSRVVADPRSVDLSGLAASVSEAQASYAQIATSREKAFIRAPFDGVVSVLPVSAGELVSGGMRVAGLVNDAGLQVKTYVNDQDRKLIMEGGSALIQGEIEGTVTHIAPSIDPETKKIEVQIAITQTDALLTIGEFVEVEISVSAEAGSTPVVVLPFQAIKTTTEASYVFTVTEEGMIEAHEVELGRIVGDAVQVESGLDSSWKIVSSTRAVRAGQQVTIGE